MSRTGRKTIGQRRPVGRIKGLSPRWLERTAYAPRSNSARSKQSRRSEPVVGVNRNDARTLLRLSFVAPDVQAAILEGRQPIGLSAKAISELDLPASWRRQRLLLGA